MSQPVVFKIGGEALLEKEALLKFLSVIKIVHGARPVVIVHGGGPQVENMMAATGVPTTKVDGVRTTPLNQLPFIVGALAGVASQQLLAATKQVGIKAVSLSLSDSDLFEAKPKQANLGAVGQVEPGKATAIEALMRAGNLVLINSIGCDEHGQTLNINADDAAVATAKLLNAQLCLLSNVPGVLDEEKQLISHLDQTQIHSLVIKGVISDGMVVKVNAALQAARYLRRPVNIGSWQQPMAMHHMVNAEHCQLGTQILP